MSNSAFGRVSIMPIFRKALDEPDRSLAMLGVLLAAGLTVWLALNMNEVTYTVAGIVSLLACLAYLVMRGRSSVTSSPISLVEAKPSTYLLLNILFCLLFSYSIISLYLRPDLYTRPVGYFVSIALMVAILGVEILFLPSRRSCTYFALFKIILIALSLEWSQVLLFSGPVGVDPWWHQWFTTSMLDEGHIPAGELYSQFPVMHLVVGATSLITDLSYKMSTMLSICLLHVVCNTMFMFLIGKLVHSFKAGLLAALLLAVANFHIWLGYWTVPNTLAATLILIIIYLLFKVKGAKPVAGMALALLSMGVLMLTHTIGALSLAILLFLFWLGFAAYHRMYLKRDSLPHPRRFPRNVLPRIKANLPINLYLPVLFTAALMGWWRHTGHLELLVRWSRIGFGASYFSAPPPDIPVTPLPPDIPVSPPPEVTPTELVANWTQSIPVSEQLFVVIGLFLFFGISFIGVLYLISQRHGNRYSFPAVLGGFVLLAIAFFGMCTERWILADRWIFLSQILLAIPVGAAFLLLCGLSKNKLTKVSPVVMLFLALSFPMIVSPTANLDNRTFLPNVTVRYAVTESEAQAMDTLLSMGVRKIGTDAYYDKLLIGREKDIELVQIDDPLITGDFNALDLHDTMVVIREEMAQHPIKFKYGTYQLDYDARHALAEQHFSKTYDCGSVSAFLK